MKTGGGRTLRDAIALALEVVPSVELAAGDETSRLALRGFLLDWVKEYALARGVILEDDDLDLELVEVITELRRAGEQLPVKVTPVHELAVTCPACSAKPGEQCASVVDASQYREPHGLRRLLAAKGAM